MKKNNYDGGYLNFFKYFFHFELLASNIIKNQTRTNSKIFSE